MHLLLDTQIFLWAIAGSNRLSKRARSVLLQADAIHVSAASIWEIAIKRGLGKIEVAGDLIAAIEQSGFRPLAITTRHAATVETLADHHHDPFDRLLVAQAICEPLHLLTADTALSVYTELVVQV